MSQTTAPDAYDALLQLLEATVPAGVEVVDGDPGTRIPNEYVALTGITAGEKAYAAMAGNGLAPQHEQFLINGEVHSYTGGQKPTETSRVRSRVFTLLRGIDLAVQQNLRLGLPNVITAVVAVFELEQGATANGGRGARLTFSVLVSAYLT